MPALCQQTAGWQRKHQAQHYLVYSTCFSSEGKQALAHAGDPGLEKTPSIHPLEKELARTASAAAQTLLAGSIRRARSAIKLLVDWFLKEAGA